MIRRALSQPRPAATGRVTTQAHAMRWTKPHLTALKRFMAPPPMMEVEITWLVESGMPRWLAIEMTAPAVVSAANPWMGCSLYSNASAASDPRKIQPLSALERIGSEQGPFHWSRVFGTGLLNR